MFGSHKKNGREAGLATRNSFASVSLQTNLFDFEKGFVPTLSFFQHPYVLAFSATTIGLMGKVIFKNEGWSPTKKGEFVTSAVEEFAGYRKDFTASHWLNLMADAPQTGMFALGKDHAEANFAATVGWITPASNDPLAKAAVKMANSMPPPYNNIGAAMLQITVKEFLVETFPEGSK